GRDLEGSIVARPPPARAPVVCRRESRTSPWARGLSMLWIPSATPCASSMPARSFAARQNAGFDHLCGSFPCPESESEGFHHIDMNIAKTRGFQSRGECTRINGDHRVETLHQPE